MASVLLAAGALLASAFAWLQSDGQPPTQFLALEVVPDSYKPIETSFEPGRPELLLVVANNMEEYLDDCGCAGDAVGGLSRVVSVAKAVRAGRFAIVLGGATGPSGSSDSKESFLRDLGRVSSAQGLDVYAVAQSAGIFRLDAETRSNEVLKDFGHLGVHVKTDEFGNVRVQDADGRELVNSVSLASRGREIALVGAWGTHLGGATFDRVLGPMYSVATSDAGMDRVRVHLDSTLSNGAVVSKWTIKVTRSVSPDRDVASAVDALVSRLFHTREVGVRTDDALVDVRDRLARNTCGGCHDRQLQAWLSSRHAHAYTTLHQVKRSRDVRCLSCHVTDANAGNGGELLGVFCGGCHASASREERVGLAPLNRTCERCHTHESDPKGHWKAAMETVCAPGETGAGECTRFAGRRDGGK